MLKTKIKDISFKLFFFKNEDFAVSFLPLIMYITIWVLLRFFQKCTYGEVYT